MIEFLPDGEEPMAADLARDANQAAFHRLKPAIDGTYPKDWFVGIHGGRVVGDAESFEVLLTKLEQAGFRSPDVLVVQAGEDTDYIWIL
jgi:hypothetical protein